MLIFNPKFPTKDLVIDNDPSGCVSIRADQWYPHIKKDIIEKGILDPLSAFVDNTDRKRGIVVSIGGTRLLIAQDLNIEYLPVFIWDNINDISSLGDIRITNYMELFKYFRNNGIEIVDYMGEKPITKQITTLEVLIMYITSGMIIL